ncbi:hypothetical protein SDC9_182927 [bioreactor metagenome]|uniref:Uncharacterized protein n=1 Tax=bioreactor metagenome TaxID=1076179 RepID=A0A645HBC6_9ZZZZ
MLRGADKRLLHGADARGKAGLFRRNVEHVQKILTRRLLPALLRKLAKELGRADAGERTPRGCNGGIHALEQMIASKLQRALFEFFL